VTLAKALHISGYDKLPSSKKDIEALVSKLDSMSESEREQEPEWLAYIVYNKIKEKIVSEAIEDFRIDFEDGFGNRPDDEEDATAVQAAKELAKGMEAGTISPFIGIRIKPFTEDLKNRGVRTLDIFLTTLNEITDGKLPDNFVVTLPKVTIPEQVKALVELFEIIEKETSIASGALKMEIMVETTQSIIDVKGRNPLLSLIKAGDGRITGAHFGTYDYTASCSITAEYQVMNHQVCDFAHHMMKVALGGTGIFLSDGATNVMPVGPHRGESLTAAQQKENIEVVHKAWKLAYDHNRHSLWKGIYQGWDLHPAQLPIRYAAIYSFFLESYEEAALRLKNFIEKAAQATLSGDVFDDAATGQGLLNFFLSAMNCGAISEEDAMATGLTLDEIRSRSFYKILEGRRS
jgi:citrate lyase beta subunit